MSEESWLALLRGVAGRCTLRTPGHAAGAQCGRKDVERSTPQTPYRENRDKQSTDAD
jgi:hypothetical protein